MIAEKLTVSEKPKTTGPSSSRMTTSGIPKETAAAPFYYLASRTDQKVLANDADKYLLLQYLNAETVRYGVVIHSFILLDDQVHMVVGRRGGLWGEEQVKAFQKDMLTGFIREQAEKDCRDMSGQKSGQKAAQVFREGRASGFYAADWSRRKYREERSCKPIGDYDEALHCCMRIHLLAVRKGYVKSVNDYWWSSYQTYRQVYEWPFLNTARILSGLASDPEEAWRAFRKMQRSEAKKKS